MPLKSQNVGVFRFKKSSPLPVYSVILSSVLKHVILKSTENYESFMASCIDSLIVFIWMISDKYYGHHASEPLEKTSFTVLFRVSRYNEESRSQDSLWKMNKILSLRRLQKTYLGKIWIFCHRGYEIQSCFWKYDQLCFQVPTSRGNKSCVRRGVKARRGFSRSLSAWRISTCAFDDPETHLFINGQAHYRAADDVWCLTDTASNGRWCQQDIPPSPSRSTDWIHIYFNKIIWYFPYSRCILRLVWWTPLSC